MRYTISIFIFMFFYTFCANAQNNDTNLLHKVVNDVNQNFSFKQNKEKLGIDSIDLHHKIKKEWQETGLNGNFKPFVEVQNQSYQKGGPPPSVYAAPPNNACGSAISLGSVSTTTTVAGTNVSATADLVVPGCFWNTYQNVWYTFVVPAGGGNYSITVAGGTIKDPNVAVFLMPTPCSLTGATQIACNTSTGDGGTGTLTTITVAANCLTAGTYYIMVDDAFDLAAGNTGTFNLTVTQTSAGSSAPSNDPCSNAYAVPSANLNGTWNTGFTTVCATNDAYGIAHPCNYASNNVWFTFQAQGPNVEITVSGTSTAFQPEINLFNTGNPCLSTTGNIMVCANDNGFAYSSIALVNILSTGVLPLTVGNYYTIMVTNEGTAGTFSIQINNPPPNPPGTDCATGALVCSNSPQTAGSNLWGNEELTTTTNGACLGQYGELNSSWYVLNVLTGGTLTFTISPVNGTDDFDYSIWKGSTCTLGAPVRCNFSSTVANTGLNLTNTNTTSSSTGSPFDQYITAATNDVYILLVNGYTPSSNVYNMTFGGTAVLGCTLPVVLPIELLNFNATLNGKEVDLKWSTSTETNNSYFTIERSADGKNFEEITRVKGAGTSKDKRDYSTIDYMPLSGVSYYRLSQTDINGKTNLLTIVSVNNTDNDGLFKVIPNPTDGMININYACTSTTTSLLNIYDSNGLLVLSKEINCVTGNNSTSLDLSDKTSGLYFVTFTANDKFYKTKLIKK